ncbi:hypothetical protein [Streptomyces lavendulae]|uniref:hypothetical protein n=1 Tax=Streptomyces lavendulae TaxID=1914 RepID=UPI0033C7AD4E
MGLSAGGQRVGEVAGSTGLDDGVVGAFGGQDGAVAGQGGDVGSSGLDSEGFGQLEGHRQSPVGGELVVAFVEGGGLRRVGEESRHAAAKAGERGR